MQELRKHGLEVFVITVIILGIFFRFAYLDRKVYWHDETLTSLRIFGYTHTELVAELFRGEVVSLDELQDFQHPSPDKDLGDTLHALMGNAEHPPLYYLSARFWAMLFGSSITDMRLLPAIISLFTLPAMYWLGWELFGSSLVAWLAVAIAAISPFHVLYAQEAREYSLWIGAIVVSSAALLRAIRLRTRGSWILYGATVAFGLYSHLIAVLVQISHTLYVLLNENLRQRKILSPYFLATGAGILAFLPWLWVVVANIFKIHDTIGGSREPLSFSSLIDKWFLNFNRLFLDHELGTFNLIFVLLSCYSLYFIVRKTPPKIWSFVIILTGVTALTLIVPDLVQHGRRSTIARYLAPCYLGIQIALAFFLAWQITARQRWQQYFGRFLAAAIISAGIIGCTLSATAEVWWTKSHNRTGYYIPVSEILNEGKNPLVLSDSGGAIGLLGLSHRLDDRLSLLLFDKEVVPDIPEGYDEIFLLRTRNSLARSLEEDYGYAVEPLHEHRDEIVLWRAWKKNEAGQVILEND